MLGGVALHEGLGLLVPLAVEAFVTATKRLVRALPVDLLCIAGAARGHVHRGPGRAREERPQVLAEVEKDVSSMLVDAAHVYEENEVALRLRTMHLLYESVKGSGGTVVIPSA